jgi:lipoate-protein ligase B
MLQAECNIHLPGLIAYEDAWRLQERLAVEIAAGQRPPTLLLLEHPPVYTFGRGGQAANLLWDEARLAARGVSVHWVDRGGDVTFHGPGQLVGYPLLPLGPLSAAGGRLPQADYTGYLRRLEVMLIAALARLGLPAEARPGLTGVWARRGGGGPPAKLAAIGVKVDARGVTRHGFSLNVNPDLSYYDGIIACGLEGQPVSSLERLLQPAPSMPAAIAALTAAFLDIFNYSASPKPVPLPLARPLTHSIESQSEPHSPGANP